MLFIDRNPCTQIFATPENLSLRFKLRLSCVINSGKIFAYSKRIEPRGTTSYRKATKRSLSKIQVAVQYELYWQPKRFLDDFTLEGQAPTGSKVFLYSSSESDVNHCLFKYHLTTISWHALTWHDLTDGSWHALRQGEAILPHQLFPLKSEFPPVSESSQLRFGRAVILSLFP